jgi:hypothetical protein
VQEHNVPTDTIDRALFSMHRNVVNDSNFQVNFRKDIEDSDRVSTIEYVLHVEMCNLIMIDTV